MGKTPPPAACYVLGNPCFVLLQAGAGGQKYVMRDLMRVLEQEKHAYTDPVTQVRGGCVVRMLRFFIFFLGPFCSTLAGG